MNAKGFRDELMKIMPGYKWTVHHKTITANQMVATGIQTSGLNRLSTLEVRRTEREGQTTYESRSSGFGTSSPWLGTSVGMTLAQSLRALQDFYEGQAQRYRVHAADLQGARASKGGSVHFQDRLAEIEGRPRPEPEGDEVEEVVACLGDDSAAMLDENPEDERALNMQRAAELLTAMQATSAEVGS